MKVSELLSSPNKWIKRYCATDERHEVCMPHDPQAARWCILGALDRCYRSPSPAYIDAALKLRNQLGGDMTFVLSDWNDSFERTFEQVINAVKQAGI